MAQASPQPLAGVLPPARKRIPWPFFGLADRRRIAPGLRADLVLVDGDPASNIVDTRKIVAVWKAGRRAERPKARTEKGARHLWLDHEILAVRKAAGVGTVWEQADATDDTMPG